jgi:hypothetical protein
MAELMIADHCAVESEIAACKVALARSDAAGAVAAIKRIDRCEALRRMKIRRVVRIAQKEVTGLLQLAHDQTAEAGARRTIIAAAAAIEGIPARDGSLSAIHKILHGVEIVNDHFSSKH